MSNYIVNSGNDKKILIIAVSLSETPLTNGGYDSDPQIHVELFKHGFN